MQRIRTLSLIIIVALIVQSLSAMAAVAAPAEHEVQALGASGPVLVGAIPSNGATAVVTDTNLKLTFDEEIIRGTGTIELYEVGTPDILIEPFDITATSPPFVQLDDANRSIVINPQDDLISGRSYYVIVPAGAILSYATGLSYAGITTNTGWAFQANQLVPVASNFAPTGSTIDPLAPGNLSFEFTREVQKGTGYIQVKRATDNVTVQTIDITAAEVTVALDSLSSYWRVSVPLRTLEYNTPYYILVDPGALKDMNNGAYAGINVTTGSGSWTFSTKPALDTTKPNALLFTPANNGTLGDLTVNLLTLKFSETVFANNNKSLIIRNAATNALVCTVSADSTVPLAGLDTMTINLSGSFCPGLVNNTEYSIVMGPDVFRDASGNYFDGVTWRFRALVDTTPPTITAYSPAVNVTSVSVSTTELSLTFNEPLAALGPTATAQLFPQNSPSVLTNLAMEIDPANNNRVLLKLGSARLNNSTLYSVLIPGNTIKDTAGNAFAGISNPYQWAFQTVTNSIPVISDATMQGSDILLTYSENLDSTKIPSGNNFYVTVNDVARAVTGVTISNKEVRLLLPSGVLVGQTVKVSYFPDSFLASKRLQNTGGNEAASFSNRTVTNTADTTLPKPISGIFSGNTVSLTFNRSLAALVSGAQNQFQVKLDGGSVGITSAAVSGTILTLTTNNTSTSAQPVSVTYYPGSYPVRDQSGNLVAAFADFYVRNVYDTVAPQLTTVTLSTNKLVITYNEGLNTANVPLKSSFSVMTNGTAAAISTVAVVNNTVELTLSQNVTANVPVQLYYYSGSPAITDLSGNLAPAIAGHSFASGTGGVAQLSSLNITNSQLVLSYSSALNSSSVPYASQYTVKYDGVIVPVTGITVSGTQVVLTLSSAVKAGQRVTLTYNISGIPLKDLLNQHVAAYNESTVTNLNGSSSAGVLKEYLETDGAGGLRFVSAKAAATGSGAAPSGKTAIRYTIDGTKFIAAYDSIKQGTGGVTVPQVTFKVPSTESAALVSIPISSIMDASSKASNASFRIDYGDLQFELPLTAVNYSKELYVAGGSASTSYLQLSIEKAPNAPVMSSLNILSAQTVATPANFTAGILTGSNLKEIDSYDQYVTRTFVIPSLSGAADNLSVVRLDAESNEVTYVPTVVENVNGSTKVSFMRKGNSVYVVVRKNAVFTDMVKHWANNEVSELASKFIITGATQRIFEPGKNITRAEFAEFIARGIGLNGDKAASARYTDVSSNNSAAAYIGAVSKAGIVEGGSDGKFRPNAAVTREEMSTMLIRALTYVGVQAPTSSTALNGFKDKAKVSGWAKDGMTICVAAGFIKGSTTNTINPQSNASRAEAAVMIKRFLEYVEFL